MTRVLGVLLACALGGCASTSTPVAGAKLTASDPAMQLGNFSVSLAVKDLGASREFYEKLGFRIVGGNAAQNWLVLQNESCTIGIFQGMFPKNMLTFNPGWDKSKQTLAEFQDVRDLQMELKRRGFALVTEADPSSTGPASLMLIDPDGNPILIDQHVSRPKPK